MIHNFQEWNASQVREMGARREGNMEVVAAEQRFQAELKIASDAEQRRLNSQVSPFTVLALGLMAGDMVKRAVGRSEGPVEPQETQVVEARVIRPELPSAGQKTSWAGLIVLLGFLLVLSRVTF